MCRRTSLRASRIGPGVNTLFSISSAFKTAPHSFLIKAKPFCLSDVSRWWTSANTLGMQIVNWTWDQDRAAAISIARLAYRFNTCSSSLESVTLVASNEMCKCFNVSTEWIEVKILSTVGNHVCPRERAAFHLNVESWHWLILIDYRYYLVIYTVYIITQTNHWNMFLNQYCTTAVLSRLVCLQRLFKFMQQWVCRPKHDLELQWQHRVLMVMVSHLEFVFETSLQFIQFLPVLRTTMISDLVVASIFLLLCLTSALVIILIGSFGWDDYLDPGLMVGVSKGW